MQMQMRVIAIPPARELADLEAIAVLCRLAASATALADEPLDQQGIAPHRSTSLGGIKETGDISKRLRLVHADKKVTSEEEDFLKQLAAKVDLPENEANMIVVAIEALNRDMLDS